MHVLGDDELAALGILIKYSPYDAVIGEGGANGGASWGDCLEFG